MSRAKLIAGRVYWRTRELAAYRKWQSLRKRVPKDDKRRSDAFKAYDHAHAMRVQRDRQIAKLGIVSISEEGLAIIKEFEGYRADPYRDVVGVWTIGYGETRGVGPNTKSVSEREASSMLRKRVNSDFLKPVLKLAKAIGWHLNQNQADALASLSYNLGPGIFDKGRSMGDAIRSKNRTKIADAFLLYDKAGSPPHPLAGLTRRRRQERELFLN